MELTLTRENPDGSADFDLQLTCIEVQQIVRVGLIEVLKRTIEEGKQYDPSIASMGDTGCGESSCKDGACEQPCQSKQYDLFPETLKVSHQE